DPHHAGRTVGSANAHQLERHRIAGVPCREISALVFEADARDAIEADLWPASGGGGRIDLFELEPELTQEWQRLRHVAVIGARHPQHARSSVELLAGGLVPLAPERERPRGHLDVLPCRPVDRANDTRLAAGARAAVARSPRVE